MRRKKSDSHELSVEAHKHKFKYVGMSQNSQTVWIFDAAIHFFLLESVKVGSKRRFVCVKHSSQLS